MTNPASIVDRLPVARAFERHSTGRVADALETRFVEVNRARRLRLFDQREIECRAVPVRIGDLVVRARRDEQLTRVRAVVDESLFVLMKEKREPSFETARDVGARSLPRAPFRERSHPWQVVSVGELFEQKVGEGCR